MPTPNTRRRFSLLPIEEDTRILVWGLLSWILSKDKSAPNTRCRVAYSRNNGEVYVFNIVALKGLTLLAWRHVRAELNKPHASPTQTVVGKG